MAGSPRQARRGGACPRPRGGCLQRGGAWGASARRSRGAHPVHSPCGLVPVATLDHAPRQHSCVGTVHRVHCRSLPDGRNNGTATRLRAQATHVRLTTAGTTAWRAADSFCHVDSRQQSNPHNKNAGTLELHKPTVTKSPHLALPQTAKCGLLVTVGLCSSSVPAFLLCGFDCCREST